ncbi:MAG TPA: Fe-S protein assembly chaperone HscA [Kofleriaceae bacterium]|nr:Fe-S protein assembly chaperone HscA [Kofleriaceae bacterium]
MADHDHAGQAGHVGGGLFQIAEPGESHAPRKCATRAVGIDLGTTNSLVAVVDNGAPRVLRGGEASGLLPSVVSYQADGVRVGEAARRLAAERPRDTIASVKRFMGRSPADVASVAGMVPYELVGGESDRVVRFRLASGREVTPVEVSAEILRALVARAGAELGAESFADSSADSSDDVPGPIEAAVITVPAYFDDAQRQATRDAGRLAGLDVLRLLAEPTAAALAYGLDQGSRGRYAVYDLGGGTFDISVLELHQGVFKVVSTGGDTALGGDDVDRVLAARLLEAAGSRGGEGHDAGLLRRALDEARAAKHRLSDEPSTEMRLGDVAVPLSRADLAEVMRPWLDRTARSVRRALRDAELATDELDGVILVGGSTKSPVVRDFVAELFGREPLSQLDPEEVVALGAAAQAHALSGGTDEVVLLDVIPLSLGIETMGGVVEKLVPRNSTIPARAVQTFTTYADDQTGFDIHVVQGERETVEGNRSLARFQLKGLPPMPAGLARVEIRFEVDADGLTRVSAIEQVTGKQAAVEVKPTYGLTEEEVERMLLDSFENAEQDLARRSLLGQRVEAEQLVVMTRAALARDGDMCDAPTRAAIEHGIAELERVIPGDDHRAIRRAAEELDRVAHPFAEARMNRAVREAVRGRRVDELDAEPGAGRRR